MFDRKFYIIGKSKVRNRKTMFLRPTGVPFYSERWWDYDDDDEDVERHVSQG